jgi:CheY-like chemotaxis protein
MTGATVLVVEDDPFVRALAVERFQQSGATVLDTYSSERALDLLARHPEVSLVFSDVRLPGRDGVTLARMVRRNRPDVRIVLTSGYVGDCTAEGAATFVAKPWQAGTFARIVREIGTDEQLPRILPSAS